MTGPVIFLYLVGWLVGFFGTLGSLIVMADAEYLGQRDFSGYGWLDLVFAIFWPVFWLAYGPFLIGKAVTRRISDG